MNICVQLADGWEMMGALLGHAVASGLAGLVLYVTGSFPLVLALSMAFSLVGVLVILRLESTIQKRSAVQGAYPPVQCQLR